jgi:starch phosphorylase
MTVNTERKSLLQEAPLPKHVEHEHVRTGLSLEALRQAFADNLFYMQGKHPARATRNDLYMALAYSVRDRVFDRCLHTIDTLLHTDFKLVCYFSAEYLLGPQLDNNLVNLGIHQVAQQALESYGLQLGPLLEQEIEPGLGTGGLGRLAACYLDSLATLEVPAIGYGIHYEFGMFKQEIYNGWQREQTDKWLSLGNPWEIARPEASVEVKFGGRTEPYRDEEGHYRVRWIPTRVIKGIPYDIPVLGYGVNNCNLLRLWQAEAIESFNFEAFNTGEYYRAVEKKVTSENITKVLYPNDQVLQGKQLRLEQQYFFVSCSLQDMISIQLYKRKSLDHLYENFAAQLNDTHPSIAVAELMRLLVDEYLMDWDRAWNITTKTLGYTNHTLLPEALEKWPLSLFAQVLPRHLEIIYEINRRFLDQVKARYPYDMAKLARMSLIDETGERYVRMAHLATVGSHSINGVSKLHTQLLENTVLPDFVEFWPEKFSNKTNGVTPRRFLLLSNPSLAALISEKIGTQWVTQFDQLRQLEAYAEEENFQEAWRQIKRANKQKLAVEIEARTGIEISPDSLFDVQVKRIHEYKRQLLNLFHVITLYSRIKHDPKIDIVPRTCIFGGKAAPGYGMAKLIIKLIHAVAEVVNHDPDVRSRLKVVFYPNYDVKNGQKIYPAADLSEQISTAGKEASGTGNMKLAMNGALTIGTLDGANIEIREEVGAENFFAFGLSIEQVQEVTSKGYSPKEFYNSNYQLRKVLTLINSGAFSADNPLLFKPLVDALLSQDPYLVLADYQAYMECQDRVSETYRDPKRWTQMSILNVARMGKFSSDRAIREYCQEIWQARPIPVSERAELRCEI